MQFSVGDKVMYPGKGAGRVTGLRRQELVDGFENYYVIEIPDRELTVSVPVRKTAELGVRQAMSRSQLARVLNTLRAVPTRLPNGYRKRQEQTREKLKTGRALPIAEVVRDLTWHQQAEHLTRVDARLLARGREYLAGEMALSADEDVMAASAKIDAALAVATARVSEEEASQRTVAA